MFNWFRVKFLKKFSNLHLSGPVKLLFSPSARLTILNGPAYFGVPILGSISSPNAYSIIDAQKNSRINLGAVSFGRGCRISLGENSHLEIGSGTYFSDECLISAATKISIGSDCAISWQVHILDDDGHKMTGRDSKQPILIGNHVWIGARVTILKGADVGDGCMIAAGSVVKGKFPSKSLIGGVPAKVLRSNIEWEN